MAGVLRPPHVPDPGVAGHGRAGRRGRPPAARLAARQISHLLQPGPAPAGLPPRVQSYIAAYRLLPPHRGPRRAAAGRHHARAAVPQPAHPRPGHAPTAGVARVGARERCGCRTCAPSLPPRRTRCSPPSVLGCPPFLQRCQRPGQQRCSGTSPCQNGLSLRHPRTGVYGPGQRMVACRRPIRQGRRASSQRCSWGSSPSTPRHALVMPWDPRRPWHPRHSSSTGDAPADGAQDAEAAAPMPPPLYLVGGWRAAVIDPRT